MSMPRNVLALWVAVLFAACGDGGGGDQCLEGSGSNCLLDGVWKGTHSDDEGPGKLVFALEQRGENVTGGFFSTTDAIGAAYSGTLTGTRSGASFTGQFNGSDGACNVAGPFDAELASTGTAMAGTYGGTRQCHGPIADGEFSLTRLPAPEEGLDLTGHWTGTGTDNSGTRVLTLDLDQRQGVVTGTVGATDDEVDFFGVVLATLSRRALEGIWAIGGEGCSLNVDFQSQATATSISGTYGGNSACASVSGGQFTLQKGTPIVATVEVTPSTGTIAVGGVVQLSASLKDLQGNVITGRSPIWSTSNSSMASVSASGLVTGVAPGSATIAATADGASDAATIEVRSGPAPPVVLMITGAGSGSGAVNSQAGLTPAISCATSAGYTSGSCQAEYATGTSVTLMATVAVGSSFEGWSGAGCTGTEPCTLLMTQARTVAAAFTLVPSQIVANSPINQTGTVGQPVAAPPSVVVRAANGQPVPGIQIGFEVTGGGTIEPPTATTNENGIAGLTVWQLGPTAGAQSVTAALAGDGTVTFTATAGPAATVETGEVTSITLLSAVLNGTVDPNGTATTAWFEWTAEPGFTSFDVTPHTSFSGTTDQSLAATVTLSPNTSYYYRAVASNGAAPIRGDIRSIPEYRPYAELMETVSLTGPLYVTGGNTTPRSALEEAGSMLGAMLRNRPDVASEMKAVGALTAVFARAEVVCQLPYFSDLTGTPSCDAQGGLGGVPGRPATACSERNVLRQADDPYGRGTREDGENVCVHELAHTIMNVGLSGDDRARILARFEAVTAEGLWAGDYAVTNADEFFAEMSQAYFCANPEIPSYLHNHGINCATELQSYDAATFALVDDIYSAAATDLR